MPDGAALAWIDQHRERLVEELRDCCRIPSVSTVGGPAMAQMADWLSDRLRAVLDEVGQVAVDGAAPAVVGRAAGAGPHSVLLYSHYDVQPPDPLDAWSSPPFAAELTADGRLVARGAADDKADVMARIHALEALRATTGDLPCTVAWLCEGGEETGSPGLAALLTAERERLRADACLWESYLRRDDGRPEVGFGCRGLVAVELRLRSLRRDQHSAFAGVFRSAPLELARALTTLCDEAGRPTIDGWLDDVAAPSPAARTAAAGIPAPDAGDAALPDRTPFVARPETELGTRLVLEPTVNVSGLDAGYTGAGVKTVLPAEARAKLDLRLVAGQTPEGTVARLRAHLDRRGFGDIEIDVRQGVPAAASPLDTPLARAVVGAAEERFGPALRYPMVPGAGPLHLLEDALGIPAVMPPGSTRMASGIHAPDEHVRVEDYLEHVAFTVRTLERLGAEPAVGADREGQR
ncbi:M20/M25/M40 family metallo-hydrolase [Patulibacter defluvii]|uniref:M20/M25/M40 family metallo-hydrolase n=1 Tax=Patulibacter defluvii TaxID=3095358 RepID=UPI002A749BA0|nr:M20/M25/M40 family metallo-hydrolase [Patulibacter sp. DM4]